VSDEYRVVRRVVTERGELSLVRRGPGHRELRVNGVFVMDNVETRSERLLATETLRLVGRPSRILLGGLGLGFTLRALLEDGRVERVVVAEIEAELVEWMRAGDVPSGVEVVTDPHVEVVVSDVGEVVCTQPSASLDAVLLDVDNGPDNLVYGGNALLYEPGFLAACLDRVRESGVLAVWSSTRSAALGEALASVAATWTEQVLPVRRGSRLDDDVIYVATPRTGRIAAGRLRSTS
jgi:spermidine synthase